MLTGTIPPYHGVHDNGDYQLDQSNVTLAEILKQSGFTTGGIISALVLDSAFGIDQGFDTYNDQFEKERKTVGDISERIGDEASRFAITWLQQHKDEKFFLFLHYFDPHAEYVPPEPFASKYAHNPYAGEIAYTDHCIGLVLSKLKELELYDSTLIIITGDHGEMLNEHGEPSHSYFIYQSAIKVPLIFRLPGTAKPRRIKGIAGLIDITPTICSLLGIKIPSQIHGMDLSACIKGHQHKVQDRHIFCESLTPTMYNANSLLGVVTDQWKYIQTTRPELYDLVKDPHETNNLINQQPHQGRILRDRLKQILERAVRKDELDSKMELDAAGRERLQSLGYVTGNIIEDFNFDQTRDDPKDLINFHNIDMKVSALLSKEMYVQAEVGAEKLVRQRPNCYIGYAHLAEISRKQKDYSATAVYLNKLLELKPNNIEARGNLGMALQMQGRLDDAISHYRIALQIDPDHAGVRGNLGSALRAQGKLNEAISHYRKAVQLKRSDPRLHNNLGEALASHGELTEAIVNFTAAIKLNPDLARAHQNLARASLQQGKLKEAVSHYYQTLRIRPDWIEPMRMLAWILATHSQDKIGNPAEAIRLAERACELTDHKDAGLVDTLAAAYAAAGRFADAAATAEKAVQLTASGDNKQRHQAILKRLQLYKARQPYRETTQSQNY
jgi:arylsulfatase A-like enzyme/Flp pilus assembly protein TadD